MGCSKSSPKREVYSNTVLTQETRKTSNRQPNYTPKRSDQINEKEMKETIVKINKTKSWFFEKINKIDKPLPRLIKKKREKNQINKIRNEKEVTIDNAEIQRIIRDYYDQLTAIKWITWKKWTDS